MAITRTAITDDDGSRTTGTILNNAWKTELYNQIDAADVLTGGVASTWTPTIGGTTSQSGQTYSSQVGVYWQLGKLVYLQADVALTAVGTITGNVQIKGLPFAAKTSVGRAGMMIPFFSGMTTSVIWMGGFIASAASAITLTTRVSAGSAATLLVQADLGALTDLLFTCLYMTD